MAKTRRMIDTLLRKEYKSGPFTECNCDNVDEVIVHTGSGVAEHERCGGLLGSKKLKGDWEPVGERRGKGLWRRK